MNKRVYESEAEIQKVPDVNGAYIKFPYDVKAKFGKQVDDTVIVIIKERE